MPSVLENLVIDAVDPRSLGRFWSGVLRAPILSDTADLVEMRLQFSDDADGFLDVCLQRVPVHQSRPHRLHLDLRGGHEQSEVVDRAISLGAAHLDVGQRDVPWVVLGDPEDNAFCVMEARPEYVETGPIAAIPIDAADPRRTADFWMAASGRIDTTPEWAGKHGYVVLRHRSLRGPLLEFCPIDEPKTHKNPMHFDLRAAGDPDDELRRLLDLGARRVEHDWGATSRGPS